MVVRLAYLKVENKRNVAGVASSVSRYSRPALVEQMVYLPLL